MQTLAAHPLYVVPKSILTTIFDMITLRVYSQKERKKGVTERPKVRRGRISRGETRKRGSCSYMTAECVILDLQCEHDGQTT
jgi:hypothetical protein